MQCTILAGGLGTRMWPETKTVPKNLLPIAGTPFATWQLSWLARSGQGHACFNRLAVGRGGWRPIGLPFGPAQAYDFAKQPHKPEEIQ